MVKLVSLGTFFNLVFSVTALFSFEGELLKDPFPTKEGLLV